MTKDFYTVDEIAELLRIRPGTVRNRLSRRDGHLPPSILIGRRRLFPLCDYETWKQQRLLERLR
jgi:excisionase family DNA binding protein